MQVSAVVFDVGETVTSDRRFWADWADWLQVPHHTLSALVGAVVAQGRDNADALRLIRPDLDLWAEHEIREAAGHGERLDESDLYPDVRPALQALRDAGLRVYIADNQTARVAGLLRALDLPVDDIAPVQAAGLKACHIRRGPWGYLWANEAEAAAADYRINSITELPGILAG